LIIVRDLRGPALTNQMSCVDERLERILPDHSTKRGLVNLTRANNIGKRSVANFRFFQGPPATMDNRRSRPGPEIGGAE
jgi:hypothetical protein